MRALILAAGRGERMRPLTLTTPKPLLEVAGKPLIDWHLEKLAAMGVRDVVVNTSWLAVRIHEHVGDGSRHGVRIRFSHEGDEPLETGGALLHARLMLGEDPFLLVNGDVWTDFDFARLPADPPGLAHLVMVPVPAQNASGDFHLDDAGLVHGAGGASSTYSGIGMFRMALLDDWRGAMGEVAGASLDPPRFPLAPLLRRAMSAGRVTGEMHLGHWTDVGTPWRLADLDQRLRSGISSRDR